MDRVIGCPCNDGVVSESGFARIGRIAARRLFRTFVPLPKRSRARNRRRLPSRLGVERSARGFWVPVPFVEPRQKEFLHWPRIETREGRFEVLDRLRVITGCCDGRCFVAVVHDPGDEERSAIWVIDLDGRVQRIYRGVGATA